MPITRIKLNPKLSRLELINGGSNVKLLQQFDSIEPHLENSLWFHISCDWIQVNEYLGRLTLMLTSDPCMFCGDSDPPDAVPYGR